MTDQRVQKILAQAGIGSRRANEGLIRAGRVTVNGKKIRLGEKADPQKDTIRVDGKKIQSKQKMVYIAVNKPRGVVSSTVNKDGRQTIVELVPTAERLYPVGRLDVESDGLVLLTNDGDLTQKLSHPKFEHEKEYKVLVAKHPEEHQLEDWRSGVELADGFVTAPAEVRVERNKGRGAWLRVVLKQGHKRQIRETARVFGLPVVSLTRVRIGSLHLGKLKTGEWRELTSEEIRQLKEL